MQRLVHPLRFCFFTSILLAAAVCSAPAQDAPDLGAGVRVADEYRLPGLDDRRFTHERYWSVLGPVIEAGGAGRVRMTELGRSVEGRSINAVTFGSGPTNVLLWSQMHGDESAASMSLADIVHWAAASPADDPVRRLLEEQLTVTMIPMLNPDGAERFIRHNALGVDVNRDARRLATPEGRILKSVRDSLEADFGFNLHDQGSRTAGPDGELVAIALLAPAADEERTWDAVRQRARHVSAVVAAALESAIPGRIARYDDTFTPRAFGDNLQAWGTSTVLIESGAIAGDAHKQELRRLNVVAIVEAFVAIADGSFEDTPTSHYDELPMNVGITNDLVVSGGHLVLGDTPYRVDVAIVYDDAVARTGPRYAEIGDLDDVRALETIDAAGLFLHPDLGSATHVQRGAEADLVIRRGPEPDSDEVTRIPAAPSDR